MKRVYIAHCFSGTPEEMAANRASAARWAAWALTECGVAPACSWIVLTGELPETPEMRRLGLEADKRELESCDEVWLVGPRLSAGMEEERAHAEEMGIPVVDLVYLSPVEAKRVVDRRRS